MTLPSKSPAFAGNAASASAPVSSSNLTQCFLEVKNILVGALVGQRMGDEAQEKGAPSRLGDAQTPPQDNGVTQVSAPEVEQENGLGELAGANGFRLPPNEKGTLTQPEPEKVLQPEKPSFDPSRTGMDRFERVVIIFNPLASGGDTARVAERLTELLKREKPDIEVFPLESKPKYAHYKRSGTVQAIKEADLVIVVGGDGTIRKLMRPLSKPGTLVYMVPLGNESLFSRWYGMKGTDENLLYAMQHCTPLKQFYGTISGGDISGLKPFFTMASMGFDSLTIAEIGKRTGKINDFIYGIRGVQAMLAYHNPVVSVTVDGEQLVNAEPGYLIVANSPAYARGLRLVPDADPGIPTLTVGFNPNNSRMTEVHKFWQMLRHRPAEIPSMKFGTGKRIEVTLHDKDYPLQSDGDYFRNRPIQAGSTLVFQPGARPIHVLAVPSEHQEE